MENPKTGSINLMDLDVCLESRLLDEDDHENEPLPFGARGRYRTLYLSHAKQALYHLSYIPILFTN
nr:hypothetical protein MtrDRAFT_AC155896g46v2 [Medicago truncatula]